MHDPAYTTPFAILVGLSMAVRGVALVFSLLLLRRMRDWRLSVLSLVIVAMIFRQALSLISILYDKGQSMPALTLYGSEFPGLGISVLALVMIIFLGRLLTERERHVRSLEESEQRYRKVFEGGPLGMGMADLSGRITNVNQVFARMVGYEPAELVGRRVVELTHPGDQPKVLDNYRRLLTQDIAFYQYEKRYMHRTGEAVWASVKVSLVRDVAGKPLYALALIEDITARKIAEARQQLMLNELDHRVKNNLAIVVALAEQTINRCSTIEQFRVAFLGRIQAMARAHEALARHKWDGVVFADMARLLLNPHHDSDSRIRLDGPPLTLPPEAAIPVSLALHELSSNAVKHGSLSGPDGQVSLTWRRLDDDRLQITWRETSAALVAPVAAAHPSRPVEPQSRGGIGHELIRGLIRYQLRGEVMMSLEATGMLCILIIPLTFSTPVPPLASTVDPTPVGDPA